jgi:hypothetical protein
MLDRVKVLFVALVVFASFAVTTRAATFAATAISPRDPAIDASMDLSRVTALFDTAGTFWVDTRVQGGTASGISSTVYAAAPAGGCGAAVASIVWTADGNLSRTVTPPNATPPQVSSPRIKSAGEQFAAGASGPGLTGIAPGSETVTISNSNGPVDTLAAVPFAATYSPPPSLFGDTPTTPPRANTGVALTANRRGVVAIPIGRYSPGLKGTVRVCSGKRTLGRKAFRVTTTEPVTVRVQLNAASRRRLARGRKLVVKIHVTGRARGAVGVTIDNEFDATIRRR